MGEDDTIFAPKDKELNYKANTRNYPGFQSLGKHVPKEIVLGRKNLKIPRNCVMDYLEKTKINYLKENKNIDRG